MCPILSIIIPAYNAANFIKQSLDSIFKQSTCENDFEVIIINDGSTDDTINVVSEYSKNHQNIHLYTQSNNGVSIARNTAIEVSHGKYIIFLDADDELYEYSLQQALEICKHNFDICICRSFYSSGKEVYTWDNLFVENITYSGIQLAQKSYIRGSACGAIFNKSFLLTNNIIFPKNVYNYEDTIFIIVSCVFAKTIIFKNLALYSILGNPNSASRSYSIERISRSFNALDYISSYIRDNRLRLSDLQNQVLLFLKYNIISNIIYDSILTSGFRAWKLIYKKIKEYLPISSTSICVSKYKLFLLNNSFPLYYLLFYFRTKK